MKCQVPFSRSHRGVRPGPAGGFTLPELLIASTLFILSVGGILLANLYGLRMFQITETKLNATDGARKTIGRMVNEIRNSKNTWLGNVHNGAFEALLDGETQQGSGLMIQPTAATTNYIIYFVNPSDQTFRRTTSTAGTTIVLAESITNAMVFRSQDLLGNVLTNNLKNRVIHFSLEFYQPKRFMQAADYYKVETCVTRRALDSLD
jgi:type II secretory pathway pseudopilin PulG